jgi:hypothetical protein
MATVNIAFVRPHILNGAVVAASGDVESQSITSSGTSQATTIAANNPGRFRIAINGGAVRVVCPTPATSVTTTWTVGLVGVMSRL